MTHIPRGQNRSQNLALLRTAVQDSRAAGVSDVERLWILEEAAMAEALQGDSAASEEHAREAEALVDREPPSAQYDRIAVILTQANVRMGRGDYAGSIPFLRRGLTFAEACCGAESLETLVLKGYLARSLSFSGHAQDAVNLLEPAMPAFRNAYHGNPDLAAPLVILARAYLETGKAEQAEAAAREAAEVQVGKVSENTARAVMPHLLLARALHAQGKDAAALVEADFACREYAATADLNANEKPRQGEALALAAELREHEKRKIQK